MRRVALPGARTESPRPRGGFFFARERTGRHYSSRTYAEPMTAPASPVPTPPSATPPSRSSRRSVAKRPAPAAPKPRRPFVAALKVSIVALAAIAALVGFALLVFLRRGDVRTSRRAAAAEARLLLEPGERVEREVNVSQRHWYHYFREMHGVLVATDRRLLYVGVEPAPLVPQREFEPQAFEEQAYAWDTLTTLTRERVFFNTARGATLRGREGVQVFAVSTAEQDRLAEIAGFVAQRNVAVRAQLERERQARLAAEFEARKPKYHTVRPGEALSTLADQYGVTLDQLRAWNGLTSDRIRAGQTLMVKPQT